MNKASWRQKLSYYALFSPVRFYFILFIVGAWLAWLWLGTFSQTDTSSFTAVFALLVKVVFWFGVAVLTLSFLSVLIPFVFFLIQKGRNQVTVRIDNQQKNSKTNVVQEVSMSVNPLWQPLLGFLNFRFVYDGAKLSPKFSLIPSGKKTTLFSAGKTGWYNWPLPTIKEYEVEKLVVYFEDIFQFFSFSARLPVKQSFFTKPQKTTTPEQALTPKKTEEQNIRIEELRRVQGEYINYKNFEDNDDVRRIVWKIYAKNKELVVRIPEVLDPFASHIYLYTSFYDSYNTTDAAVMQGKGLNYFKNASWSIYEYLKKQGMEVRFVPDQEVGNKHFSDETQRVEYIVATSEWQHEKDLKQYVNLKDASVLVVSSLTDVAQVENLLQQSGSSMSVVFVKLSNSLKKHGITQLVRWLFIQDEKDKDKTNMVSWNMSGLKSRIMKNEKLMEAALQRSDAKTLVI